MLSICTELQCAYRPEAAGARIGHRIYACSDHIVNPASLHHIEAVLRSGLDLEALRYVLRQQPQAVPTSWNEDGVTEGTMAKKGGGYGQKEALGMWPPKSRLRTMSASKLLFLRPQQCYKTDSRE